MRKLVPLRNRIFVKRIENTTSMGGIVLPGNLEQQTSEGEVVAVGPGYKASLGGDWIKPSVKEGDIVLYAPTGPGVMEINFEGNDFVSLLDDSFVMAVIKGDKDEPCNIDG